MYDNIPNRDKDEFTCFIEDKEIIIESASLVRTMDTGADACNIVMPWQPGLDKKLDEYTYQFSYSNARIYLGGILQSEMILYNSENKLNNSGNTKILELYSKIADIIDSTVQAPYEMNYVSLTERCRQQCKPFGINVIVGDDVAESLMETRKVIQIVGTQRLNAKTNLQTIKYENLLKPGENIFGNEISMDIPIKKSKWVRDEIRFSRVVAEPTDKIFEHLAKLAAQRGLLLSCTVHGDLLITKANVNAKSVGTIEEGVSMLPDQFEAKFNGRDRYSIYRSITRIPHMKKCQAIQKAFDKHVKIPRVLTFNAPDTIPGAAKDAAKWRKNKSAADSMTIKFPVNGWYAPNGTLWKPNTAVTVISPTIGVANGFTFLISRVEFKFDSKGTSSILQLMPPTVYSGDEIIEPWFEK